LQHIQTVFRMQEETAGYEEDGGTDETGQQENESSYKE
jgi:hypothetical protein